MNIFLASLIESVPVTTNNSIREDKIISYEFAELGEFPYFATLKYKGRLACGGALISLNTVLTAAHCVIPYLDTPIEDLTVVLGSINLDSQQGISYSVKSLHPHELYNRNENSNDIGIVKVQVNLFLIYIFRIYFIRVFLEIFMKK